MKTKFKLSTYMAPVLSVLIISGLGACKKQNSMGYTPGKGAPVISSVRALGKALADSITKTYTTYDSTGAQSTSTVKNPPSGFSALDSVTLTGNLNNYYIIIGQNLGSATNIYINKVNIYFNRALGSDTRLVFNIPSTIPTTQPQPNTLSVTTLYGKYTYKFTVLPPSPTIQTFSTNDFTAGSVITLTGQGFAAVTSVKLQTTSDAAAIVSQNDSTLVLKMPVSSAITSPLLFTYTSGSNTGATAISSVKFNDLDNSYEIFTDGFDNGWYSNSWGPGVSSTAQAKTGTASFAATYPKGNYWADGFGSNLPLQTAGYTYLSFWIKGGLENYTLYLTADTRPGGFGNSDSSYPISVPANVWTYFKLPLATLSLQGTEHFGFWIAGPADQDETFYYDDVVLLKQ